MSTHKPSHWFALSAALACSLTAPGALAQAAAPPLPAAEPSTPATAAPPAAGASEPTATPTPDSAAWDAAIKKGTQEERALETDEERERREERLRRGQPLEPSGRLGPRFDTGIWLLDEQVNFQSMVGAQLVHPFGQIVEVFVNAGLGLGAGRFFSYGPMVNAGARLVFAERYFGGIGVNLSALNAKTWSYTCDSGDVCGDIENEELTPLVHGLVTFGAYLDRMRQVELGVDLRMGLADTVNDDFSFLPTAHITYLFPLW